MSIEAVKQFNQIAEDDPEIKKSLEAATDSESLINLAVEIGSQRDFRKIGFKSLKVIPPIWYFLSMRKS
ncbi:Nif11-like leader peptide family natural product precursor [Dolichospermum planctonicum UHCC 0167]|jgi:hypothetical protein|uniref:Nif11-like leader peptide family natural product precursor n=1 Tax=Dolichospermum planctonicum TaxID=136072 RepID=UPI00144309F5|nr:Nif11-like leader peptide family natural product precursor [Dolichospermum planctonicum]MCW9679438.1 Nif11-like leader peptide family natural product precursor [Dolichospermum planctonicum UHCC 0167]